MERASGGRDGSGNTRGRLVQQTELLVCKLAETREALRQIVARFGHAAAMRAPIARLREQEAKLLHAIRAGQSRR